MIRFSMLGISVQVQPWFWITMAFIGGGLHASNSHELLLVAVFMFAGFLSILVHELGHAVFIRKYGLPTSITLQAFGGFAAYPAGQLNRMQSFVVTAAGPAVQIALGVFAIVVVRSLNIPEDSLFGPFMTYLIWVSIVWAVLNCLPIYPMDGGQMLAAVLGPNRQGAVYLIGVFVAVSVGLAGYLLLNTILLPAFMAFFAWQNWQAFQSARG